MDLGKQLELAERSRRRQHRVAALEYAVKLAEEGRISPALIIAHARDFVNFLDETGGPQHDEQ